MPEYRLLQCAPGATMPKFFYFNECGTFELNEDVGTAVYAWPPRFYHNGAARPDPFVESYHDRLVFRGREIMELPGGKKDEGWIYQAEGQNFFFYFSDEPYIHQTYHVHKLYYSTDGANFQRWLTEEGTRRRTLHAIPETEISTDPGDISLPPGGVPQAGEMRFGLGTHKLPNEYRVCPNNPFGGKNHGIDSRSFSLKIWVDVRHPTVESLRNDITGCLRDSSYSSAIAAIIAAYYSGGNPAAAWGAFYTTFISTFPTCVRAKTGESIDFTLDKDEIRGSWSGKH